MKIGDMRKQISIQQEQPTPDGAGGYALAWVTLATVWADIMPVSGRETFAAAHLEGRVTHKITLRWRGDVAITSDMRVLYNTRAFNIHAVMNNDESDHFITILAEEGGPL
ncbi:MAG: phage head closure protein [Alphaproteobacteria bacterium]|nr:phage head closure protein [Alphaproteobacteria bacterium]